ncbi:MAG: DUF4397 domain-containing protein [Bacteroidota bacterium]
MMRSNFITNTLLLVMMLVGYNSFAQRAAVQIIHNSGDPAADTVDVYVNGILEYDDVAYRTATGFDSVIANLALQVTIAPGNSNTTGNGINDSVAGFSLPPLVPLTNYVVMANGVVDTTNFNRAANGGLAIQFGLDIIAPARSTGTSPVFVDVAAIHGATDAPDVDVFARGVTNAIIDDLAYSTPTGYLSLLPQAVILDVAASSDSTNPVASFYADLTGLGGGSAVVFASGFLDPSTNPAGVAPFGLFAALSNGTVVEFPRIGEAAVQIIHNSADQAAAVVDIYIDSVLAYDDVAYQTATAFDTVPSNVPFGVGIAPGTSNTTGNGANDIIAEFPFNLMSNTSYVVAATGVLDTLQFDRTANGGLAIEFDLKVIAPARQAGVSGTDIDLAVIHGATDAPDVDVFADGTTPALLNDLPYGQPTGYVTIPATDYVLGVAASADSLTVLASFYADLSSLGGGAGVVLASGFLNPANNPGGTEPFGLFAVLPTGGPFVRLPQVTESYVQIIHNSADLAASVVDIYIDSMLAYDDVAYQTATSFDTVQSNVPFEVGIAPGTSNSTGNGAQDILATFPFTLMDSIAYVAVATGVLDTTQFDRAANGGQAIAFDLKVIAPARQAGVSANTVDLAVIHGATDAPDVDVFADGATPALLNDLPYGQPTGYVSLAPTAYVLGVAASADSTNILASFYADLNGLGGGAGVVLASGFLNPANNTGGSEPFGLFAVLPNGGPFIRLPQINEAYLQVIHNSADDAASTVDIYVDSMLTYDDVDFRTATSFDTLQSNIPYLIGIAPGTSNTTGNGAQDILATFPVTLMDSIGYVAVATGVLDTTQFDLAANGGLAIQFDLKVIPMAQQASGNTNEIAVAVIHGATDAPDVDVFANGTTPALVNDLAFGTNTGYVTIAPAEYVLEVAASADSTNPVAGFYEDLSGLGGGAAVVFASGFLDPSNNTRGSASFGLFAALPDGNIVPFNLIGNADAQIIHNSADPGADTVDIYISWIIDSVKLDNVPFRRATGFTTLPSNVPLTINVAGKNSTGSTQGLATFDPTLATGENYTVVAAGVLDPMNFTANPSGRDIGFSLYVTDDARQVSSATGNVDFRVFHGATDVDSVDVLAGQATPPIVDNIAFSDFDDYLSIAAGNTTVQITPFDDNTNILFNYDAPLAAFEDSALVIFASGFLDATQGPAFELWVAEANGNTFPLQLITSISEEFTTGAPSFLIYPNPVNGNGVVEFEIEENQAVNLQLMNAMGQSVLRMPLGMQTVGTKKVNFSTEGLTPGVYIFSLETLNGRSVQKIVVQ